jgi:acyl-CoA oxidase
MSPPAWVAKLKPSGPQGSDLLKAERAKSNISVDKLANFLFTKKALDRQEKILAILTKDKVFDKDQNYFAGRVEKFPMALARAKRLRQLQTEHNWDYDDYLCANELMSEPGPYGLHASMYIVSISVWETLTANTE